MLDLPLRLFVSQVRGDLVLDATWFGALGWGAVAFFWLRFVLPALAVPGSSWIAGGVGGSFSCFSFGSWEYLGLLGLFGCSVDKLLFQKQWKSKKTTSYTI
ncbi:PREDICTED: uncharacterized protein LOC105109390 [Populus euphratica]|uniref:Uncharacterized protein LOC105109390 n=1 Tax=Populus euphratica TaxID=75702 RepID=A0AAJ6T1E2_POPEU|nr:PREDICTED: uncharacterized protein LOC105109390 [Populus euphratica]